MSEQSTRDRQIHSAMELIMRMCRAHHRIVERYISELGIHRSQHRMLMDLARTGRTPAQKELAQNMDITPASAANMLKRLESGGYITRSVQRTDGRCNEVEITGQGHQVVEKSRQIFCEIDRRMFIGLTEEEIEALRGCMEKIHVNLRAMEEEMGCPEKIEKKEVSKP